LGLTPYTFFTSGFLVYFLQQQRQKIKIIKINTKEEATMIIISTVSSKPGSH